MNKFDSIANEYVKSLGEILPGYKYNFQNRREFFFKIYYDFVFVDEDGNIPKEPPVAGGVCGFTIDTNTNEIETLSFGELRILENKQIELEDVYEKIINLENIPKNLLWLKSKYSLKSSELLRIQNIIANTKFTKHNVIEELSELIMKFRE